MSKTIYNLSSGPAMMPPEVLERAREEMHSIDGIGMSVMEISHRSKEFGRVLAAAEQGIRDLLAVPNNYKILFLQGGATLQFSMVPMNLLGDGEIGDYVVTGAWGEKAFKEAKRLRDANVIYSSETTGFRSIPDTAEINFNPNAGYVHYTSNETIDGVEFHYDLDAAGVPVVCDASSNILSKPIDIEKYLLIYAGAQKNIGPSGVTIVIIREDLLSRSSESLPSLLNYRLLAENDSMLNTPNTWGIYMISLVCDWLREQGGVAAMATKNKDKAKVLYDAIDSSDGFYSGHAERNARSLMNVTFRLPSPELDVRFCSEADKAGFNGLAGHRSVGGVRASIYNAFPREGVEKLVEFMSDFMNSNG